MFYEGKNLLKYKKTLQHEQIACQLTGLQLSCSKITSPVFHSDKDR